jgi:hypothetical protein
MAGLVPGSESLEQLSSQSFVPASNVILRTRRQVEQS